MSTLDVDLEAKDLTACKELIRKLVAERERRREYTERLQEKLKALNNELAARKEEVESSSKELKDEQTLNRRLAEQRREQGENRGDEVDQVGLLKDFAGKEDALERQKEKVRQFVEEQLQSQIERKLPKKRKNSLDINIFSETDLMIDKRQEEQDKENASVDTVLITYIKPNCDAQYNLSYRVDARTLSKKLREDACHYWGVSPVEFVLKTIENSKVHDNLTVQNCFRRDEQAHLILAQKTPKRTDALKKEYDTIWPVTGKEAMRNRNKEEEKPIEEQRTTLQNDRFYVDMMVLPGLWKFMTQGDRKVDAHLDRINLSHLIFFCGLFVLNCISFLEARPPNEEFFTRWGIHSALTEQWLDMDRVNENGQPGAEVAAFDDITSDGQAWDWLTYTLSRQLFRNTSRIRMTNYLPGYLSVRMQQAERPRREQCADTDLMMDTIPSATTCQKPYLNTGRYEKDGLKELALVKLYWEGCGTSNATMEECLNMTVVDYPGEFPFPGVKGQSGRLTSSSPWKWEKKYTDSSRVGLEAGVYQRYDGSGFHAEYDLQFENLTDAYQAFREDMQFLKWAGWISGQTRSVHVDFAAYNGNHNVWISNWYLLEMPPNGLIIPYSDIALFQDLHRELSFPLTMHQIIDFVRFILVVYLLTYHVYMEISFERQQGGRAWTYLLFPLGIADILIGVGTCYVLFVRWLINGYITKSAKEEAIDRTGFTSMKTAAYMYEQHTIVEACIGAVIIFRLCAYLRINRHIFIIWYSIYDAFCQFSRFLLVSIPVIIGFCLLSHNMLIGQVAGHGSFTESFTHLLMNLYGVPLTDSHYHPPVTLAYDTFFFACIVLILCNSWIAVLIQSYQKVRVEAGYKPRDYYWTEYKYAEWSLFSPCLSLYLRFRPNIKKPEDPDAEYDQ